MKKNVLILLGILSTVSSASTPMLRSFRLQYGNIATTPGGSSTFIRVHHNGDVTKHITRPNHFRVNPEELVTKLDAHQMDRIERLIDSARTGGIVSLPPTAYCFIPPLTEDEFVADNGKIILRKGHICTGFKVNNAKAAGQLVVILESLRKLNPSGCYPSCPPTKVINCMPPISPDSNVYYCSNRAYFKKYCGTSFVD